MKALEAAIFSQVAGYDAETRRETRMSHLTHQTPFSSPSTYEALTRHHSKDHWGSLRSSVERLTASM